MSDLQFSQRRRPSPKLPLLQFAQDPRYGHFYCTHGASSSYPKDFYRHLLHKYWKLMVRLKKKDQDQVGRSTEEILLIKESDDAGKKNRSGLRHFDSTTSGTQAAP